MRLIDADALYEQIAKKEELARQRVLDTPSRMPNGDFNPSAMRYATQLNERTQMKFMITDAPTIEPEQHWIPLADKEPTEEGEYLVSFDDGFVATTGYYDGDFELWADAGEPTAWMPLPEPWKGEEE